MLVRMVEQSHSPIRFLDLFCCGVNFHFQDVVIPGLERPLLGTNLSTRPLWWLWGRSTSGAVANSYSMS